MKTTPLMLGAVGTYVGTRMASRLLDRFMPPNAIGAIASDALPAVAALGVAWAVGKAKLKYRPIAQGIMVGSAVRGAEVLSDYIALKTGTNLLGLGAVPELAPGQYPQLTGRGEPLDVPAYQSDQALPAGM